MISHDAILAVMEKRFDHVSARVVLGEALKVAGLAAGRKGYDPDEVRSLATALAAVGTRVDTVTAALNDLAGSAAPASGKKPTAEPEPAPEEPALEAPPEEPALEAPPEEPAPEAEAPSKKKKKK